MAGSLVHRFAVLVSPGPMVVGAIAVLLAAGCSSSGPSGSGPSGSVPSARSMPATSSNTPNTPGVAGVDACSLVSAGEASAVVGTVREPVPLSRAASSTPAKCDYVGLDPNNNSNTTVEVTVRTTTPTEFAARCETSGTAFPGIGDAACGVPKAFLLRKGTTEVDFAAATTLGAGQVTMNFSVLAQTVASRL